MCERERVCVCVRERERERVCVRKGDRECERENVCLCMSDKKKKKTVREKIAKKYITDTYSLFSKLHTCIPGLLEFSFLPSDAL